MDGHVGDLARRGLPGVPGVRGSASRLGSKGFGLCGTKLLWLDTGFVGRVWDCSIRLRCFPLRWGVFLSKRMCRCSWDEETGNCHGSHGDGDGWMDLREYKGVHDESLLQVMMM